MKKTGLLLIAAIFISLTTFAQSGDWQPLFNGKNFKGWKKLNGTAEYKIQDGAIVGISKMGTPNTFLTTEKMYGDFILELEFKVDNGLNSGIQFRSNSLPEYKDGRVHGYQYEIDPSERAWSGGIYDEARRGWLYYMDLNPAGKKAFKANAWNKVRIQAVGNSIRTWLNGIPVSNVIDDMTPSGFIALQVHSIGKPEQNGLTVSWRDIKICTTNLEANLIPDYREIYQANCIANTISKREAEEGWKLLWDGKTTAGWKGAKLETFPKGGWEIKDGILKVLKSGGGESTNGGDIITTKKYKDFELTVDFMLTEGANSGVKYFVDPTLNKGAGSSIGCEFQILDDAKHPDAKLGVLGNRTLGSLYDLIPAPETKPLRKGFFNTAKVIVKGNHVEHWLNNVKLLEYERNNQMWDALVNYSKYKDWENFGNFETGNILLQDHGDEVLYKNIKIKEL